MERLAGGLRINRASDDPAGLVISEQLRSQIGSLNQEIENTTNLIHKYQAGSSTVSELRGQLTEMRSLAVSATNEGFNDEAAQAAYAATADYLVGTYNHTIDTATYNGMNLLDGSEGSLAEVTAIEGIDLSSAESAEASIAVIDEAIAELDSVQVDLGATQANELESRRSSLEVTVENLTAAESQLRDLDYAQEYSNMVGNMIRMQASAALFAHHRLGANTVLQLFGAE
jgi:flagellin